MLMRQMGSQKTERIWLGVGTRLRAARSAFFFFFLPFSLPARREPGLPSIPLELPLGCLSLQVLTVLSGLIAATMDFDLVVWRFLEVTDGGYPGWTLASTCAHMYAHPYTANTKPSIYRSICHTHMNKQTSKQNWLAGLETGTALSGTRYCQEWDYLPVEFTGLHPMSSCLKAREGLRRHLVSSGDAAVCVHVHAKVNIRFPPLFSMHAF